MSRSDYSINQAQFPASGHVTKVYFYSNNSESHYQSPSSLPVYSSVTKINTATGNREGHERGHTLPDTARPASNKSKSSSITKLPPELSLLSFRHCHSLLVILIVGMRIFTYWALNLNSSQLRPLLFSEELKNIVVVQGDSRNHNIISSVSVDGSYHPAKEIVKIMKHFLINPRPISIIICNKTNTKYFTHNPAYLLRKFNQFEVFIWKQLKQPFPQSIW